MFTEDQALANWVGFISPSDHLVPEMASRIGGDEPLAICADPRGGLIWLGMLVQGLDGWEVRTLAKWTAVQAENVKRLHEMAKYIVETGVGSLR